MNLNDPALLNIATNIASSIQVIFNPNVSSEDRHKAIIYCENFRSGSAPLELCSVGFILIGKFQTNIGTVQHDVDLFSLPQVGQAGFQFVEDVVKYSWPLLNERELVKGNMVHMMNQDLSQTLPHYLHEMVARVIVEIAKKEWPQLWPDLFTSLFQLITSSDLPLLILRRLAEDVFVLQKVDSTYRRKDLSQSLNAISEEVISALYRVLLNTMEEYERTKSEILKRRIKLVLESMLPYLEWSKLSYFLIESRIPILFSLLQSLDIRIEGANCIIELLERKVRKEDRFEIPNACLASDAFSYFLNSLNNFDGKDEEFLNKLGEILKSLGSGSHISQPNFDNFLNGVLAMARRAETTSVGFALVAMNNALRHYFFKEENDKTIFLKLEPCLNELLHLVIRKCTSSPPSPTEKDEMNRIRLEFSTMIRIVGKLLPNLYSLISSWLRSYLTNPASIQVYQWETLVLVLSCVQSFVTFDKAEIVQNGLQDLEHCLSKFMVELNLEIKSFLLSGVSSLFVFIALSKKRNEYTDYHSKLLSSVLEAILGVFHQARQAGFVDREIRRHAAALLVKLSADFPEILMPSFDGIYSSVGKVLPTLSTFEYQCMVESMLLISNAWEDNPKQSAFIGLLVNQSEWKQISDTTKNLANFAESFRNEGTLLHERTLFSRNLQICYAILRRVKVKKSDKSSLVTTPHPALSQFLSIIPTVMDCMKAIHSLVEHSDLKFALELSENEMSQAVGIPHWHSAVRNINQNSLTSTTSNKPQNQELLKSVQSFARITLESTYGILRLSFISFTPDIYSVPQIGEMFLHSVGVYLHLLNDYRLCNLIRFVLKYFLTSCPANKTENVIKPFLQNYIPFMLTRLQTRWSAMALSIPSSDIEEDKELIDNSILRSLSKEYFDLILQLLGFSCSATSDKKACPDASENNLNGEMEVDAEFGEAETDMDDKNSGLISNFSQTPEGQSEVGAILLQDQTCLRGILHISLIALRWNDNFVNSRASRCLLRCWNAISKELEISRAVFTECLLAMLTLSDPETLDILQRLIDLICVTWLTKDEIIDKTLMEWGVSEDDMKRLVNLCQLPKNEKNRKLFFRKLCRNNPHNQGTKSTKSKWLENLPKLVIYNQEKMMRDSISVNLAECSSDIH